MKDFLEKTNKKTLVIGGIFLLLVFIIIFGGALLYNKLFYKVSYEKVENILKEATVEYLNDREEKLPQNINESITITENTLVSAEKMKPINELLKEENNSCTGEVIVTKINDNYRYNPILDCGDKYKNVKFIDYIKENVKTTEAGDGLYNLNNELVYRGEKVNNYLTFSNKTYRIVKFRNEYTVLILTDKSESTLWDDRYNINKEYSIGINDYNISRIKDYLNEMYEKNTLISETDKLLIVSHNAEIGKRNLNDTNKDGTIEKSKILENQYITLLPAYDFLNASIDNNCVKTSSESCVNYNYLAKFKSSWWLATANNENTHQVYNVKNTIKKSTASNSNTIRPVIYLTKDIVYVSGDGSKENPYTIR